MRGGKFGRSRRALTGAGFMVLALFVTAGCGKEDPGKNSPPNPDAATERPNFAPGGTPREVPPQFVAARKTFDRTCAKCHSTEPGGGFPGGGFAGGPPGADKGFKGFGGKGMMKGPSLAKV